MTQLLDVVVSWRAFLVLVLMLGFMPGVVLRMVVMIYPREDPRRKELVAELYCIPWIERPLWVASQSETALFDGLPSRIGALRKGMPGLPWRRHAVERLRKQITIDVAGSAPDRTTLHADQRDAMLLLEVMLSTTGSAFLVGDPGAGKTAIAKTMAREIASTATGRSMVPVVASMRRWDPQSTSLAGFLVAEIGRRYGVPDRTARRLLVDERRVLAILDGLDEIASATSRRLALRAIGQPSTRIPTLVTSRPLDPDCYPNLVRQLVYFGSKGIGCLLDPHPGSTRSR